MSLSPNVGNPGDGSFGEIGGHEYQHQVGIRHDGRVTKYMLVHLGVIVDEPEFLAAYPLRGFSVVCEGLHHAVCNLALLHDGKKQCPVLSLADGGHVEFSKGLGVIDGCEAPYLVVVLQLG